MTRKHFIDGRISRFKQGKNTFGGYDFVFNEIIGNRDLIAKSARSGTFKAIRGMCHKLSNNLYPTSKEMSYQMMFGEWLMAVNTKIFSTSRPLLLKE